MVLLKYIKSKGAGELIRKIKWNNHEILGNLELDLSKGESDTYNTIILAGENGSGKTTILETLSSYLNTGDIQPFEEINYDVGGKSYSIIPNGINESAKFPDATKRYILKNKTTGVIKEIGVKSTQKGAMSYDQEDIRYYGCVNSKARSGFPAGAVKSSTTSMLDDSIYESDTKDNFTDIKQLLVDISIDDSITFSEIGQASTTVSWIDFEPNSKLYRFKKAFNEFFDTMKFKRVEKNSYSVFQIVFEKNNKEIDIDSLSTGEKQIVFRGAHLLKNNKKIDGGIALIDEPELSMHPKWQSKILQYYRGLFTISGKQKVQTFIATHSDYVLRAGLEDKDNVLIIILKDKAGKIAPTYLNNPPFVLPNITPAETNYLAFGVATTDYHTLLYGYLQDKTSNNTVKGCDNYITNSPNYDKKTHDKPSPDKAGKLAYQTLPTFIRNAIHHPDSSRTYSNYELETSIELLRLLCK